MDLTTTYLGLTLRNPIIVGASPLCDTVEGARRLEDKGAAALVMRSLFEEQLAPPGKPGSRRKRADLEEFQSTGFGDGADYRLSPSDYLRQVRLLKGAVGIPVIASLNGLSPGGWLEFAKDLESAGADAIELNCYRVVTEPEGDPRHAESDMLRILRNLTVTVRIPISVKLSPYHSSLPDLAVSLDLAGAAGLVLFNRFYQPDFDIEALAVQPHLRLSDSSELLLRLRWLAILSPLTHASLAATGGIHHAEDLVKSLLAGAHAVQLVSVLLEHGPDVIPGLLASLESWMQRRGHGRIGDFRGLLDLRHCPDSAAFERANYIRTLRSWQS